MTQRYAFSASGGMGRLGVALLLAAAALWAALPLAPGFAKLGGSGNADDSFASFFICYASGAPSPDAQTGRPGPNQDRSGDCFICQLSCCGAAPIAARPGSVGAAPFQRTTTPWMVADRAAPTPRSRLSHRPRAPPLEPA